MHKKESSIFITYSSSPCHHCELREVGCHSGCPTYEKYREEVDRINDIKREERRVRFAGLEDIERLAKIYKKRR